MKKYIVETLKTNDAPNTKHSVFREKFFDTIFSRQETSLASYLSHTPKKNLNFYLEQIEMSEEEVESSGFDIQIEDYSDLQLCSATIQATMQYAQFLLKHFAEAPVMDYFLKEMFSSETTKNKMTFALTKDNVFKDENIATYLQAFAQVVTHLPIKADDMRNFLNVDFKNNMEMDEESIEISKEATQYIVGVYCSNTLRGDVRQIAAFRSTVVYPAAIDMLDKFVMMQEKAALLSEIKGGAIKAVMKI